MEKSKLLDLEERELSMLDEFLVVLRAERDAIVSFSLEGIVRENNRKEELLKRLEFVKEQKLILGESESHGCSPSEAEALASVRQKIDGKLGEVRKALEKNMGLLSFSMDHVRTSLEKIIEFVNRSSYDKGRSISVMGSRKV